MKFSKSKPGLGVALYSDVEININVQSKVLAAGTKFSNSFHGIAALCPGCYCLLALHFTALE